MFRIGRWRSLLSVVFVSPVLSMALWRSRFAGLLRLVRRGLVVVVFVYLFWNGFWNTKLQGGYGLVEVRPSLLGCLFKNRSPPHRGHIRGVNS